MWIYPALIEESKIMTRQALHKLIKRCEHNGVVFRTQPHKGKGGGKEYWSEDFPVKYQKKFYKKLLPKKPVNFSIPDHETTSILYSESPEYNRAVADRANNYLRITDGMVGNELKEFLVNLKTNDPNAPSFQTLMRWRLTVKTEGLIGLIGNYGNRRGVTVVSDDMFEYFKGLYLKEGEPGAAACRDEALGYFCNPARRDCINAKEFPSADAFIRRLNREVGVSAVYLARSGFSKWNRKFASYIERDYTKITAGQVWVSDHAQIDVAVKNAKTGKPTFGWITSFIDMKTSKTLSCFYHVEAPNSDHIFQAFYMAVSVYGLPNYIYIDNGKDYRCKDFAGGRTTLHKVTIDEGKATSMLAGLGVIPKFAKPYNAQAKTIERWHLKIKERLSKHAEGYRGGNVVERPERLAEDIKRGNILDFEVFEPLLQDFLFNVLNKTLSDGKGCQGKSPDDVWNLENPVKREISREALRLFCMRTSQPLSIRRNGVRHPKFDVTYLAEWMIPLKGTKVYLRIAPDNINNAWVFRAETDEYLGNASIKGLIHPLAESEIDKAELNDALASKEREKKTVKALGYKRHIPDTAERLNNQKIAAMLKNPTPVPAAERTVTQILPNSNMQRAVNENKKREKEGKTDNKLYSLQLALSNAKEKLMQAEKRIIRLESDKPAKQAEIAYWINQVAELERELAGNNKNVKKIKEKCSKLDSKELRQAVNE